VTVPSSPDSTIRRTVRKSPSQRRFWNTVKATPAASKSSTSAAAGAAAVASGLSTTTAMRRASAARATGTCSRFGVATTSRSMPSLARRSSASASA